MTHQAFILSPHGSHGRLKTQEQVIVTWAMLEIYQDLSQWSPTYTPKRFTEGCGLYTNRHIIGPTFEPYLQGLLVKNSSSRHVKEFSFICLGSHRLKGYLMTHPICISARVLYLYQYTIYIYIVVTHLCHKYLSIYLFPYIGTPSMHCYPTRKFYLTCLRSSF